jgi:hypothetical protein
VDAVPTSRDYVEKIAKIRENWYENDDFERILDVYLEGIERIPEVERELVKRFTDSKVGRKS